ncbi:threonine ammonia-lyase, biosynthetic [Lentisphaera profundi]|uniref:L-threonine dehydratase n=1 Tax=Lentisphaera profundi TaxID=1658616 RepID=A0ABY7VZP2_9BACT|nr:threonine ammonia-lyase, biosynthetic [Lentisphaera profundi]WDE97483.1 threonine ammonia-lyase, biosynthetic [Lentisphaera profundi]
MKPSSIIKDILSAKIYDLAVETPLNKAFKISKSTNNHIYLKREDLQGVFSFKIRGAYNKMRKLDKGTLQRGVIAASAGNHAQGVAQSAKHLNIPATIVMPTTTPQIKIDSVIEKGAEVILYGDNFDQACLKAFEIQKSRGLSFIHPYDDWDVIAGQGTIGVEILKQLNDEPDFIFIPVGGGGIAAGIATFTKYLSPHTKIIAVECEDSACFQAAFQKGEPVQLSEVGIFADGIAVGKIGNKTFELMKDNIDEAITVSTDEICSSIKTIFEETRVVAEPAGATALAGVVKYIKENNLQNKRIVTIISGANTSFGRLRHISERTELGSEKEALFAISIPEEKGSFRRFCQLLEDSSITEFNYRYNNPKKAQLFVGIELKNGDESRLGIINNFKKSEIDYIDLSHNEIAKLHLRHMLGGQVKVEDEHFYRVQFPEKPGALLRFLNDLGSEFNISLFHYRNHASAHGRVFLGIQHHDSQYIEDQLKKIAYPYFPEDQNPACRLFTRN